MRASDAAIQVLIETDNPSVMYGDEWLCHQIAARLGWAQAFFRRQSVHQF